MIPVEVTPAPWHYTTFWDWVDHWQTLIAGLLAFVAGVGTVVAAIAAIWVTRLTARKQIDASREEANRVIAVTREQTETTIRLERERVSTEDRAFRAMVEAAMTRVLAEVAWAKTTYPDILTQPQGLSHQAFVVRQCITKGAFAELRAACVRQGGPLTGEFLDLEREIDSFAAEIKGLQRHAGLGEQLSLIEAKAIGLRNRAAER